MIEQDGKIVNFEKGDIATIKHNICENDTHHCGWTSEFFKWAGKKVKIDRAYLNNNVWYYAVTTVDGEMLYFSAENSCFEQEVQNVTYVVEYTEVVQGKVIAVKKQKKFITSSRSEAMSFVLTIAGQDTKYKNIIMGMEKENKTVVEEVKVEKQEPNIFIPDWLTPPTTHQTPPPIPRSDEPDDDDTNPCDNCNGDDCDSCMYGSGSDHPCDTGCDANCDGCAYN